MPTNIIIFIVYTGLSFVITNKKAGTTSLLTSFLPVCRGIEADRQEAITTLGRDGYTEYNPAGTGRRSRRIKADDQLHRDRTLYAFDYRRP